MKIHLSAVAGTAMAPLAGLLREAGHEVTGSDQAVYPPMSTQLEAMGITVRSPYAEANIPADVDLVVIGNALSRGNPEVEAVLDRKLRMTSMPALMAELFIRGRTSIVVAGTHGKTTTTSMLAFLLDRAGADPSFLIGGVPVDFDRSYRLGRGPCFVIEGDEYDTAFFDKRPKLVHYMPDIAIIGNVEYDHADIYPDLAAVQTAFLRFMNVIPRRGLLIAGIESPALAELLPKAFCRVETFGIGVDADWIAEDVEVSGEASRFCLVQRTAAGHVRHGSFEMRLAGHHNVRNAVAALAAASAAGVRPEDAREALARFGGVKRRLELRGVAAGVAVYDDFAHHPTAVRATLEAVRQRAGAGAGRLVAIFEPRSYTSRTRVFQEDYARAFEAADVVVIAAAHLPGKVPPAERISEGDLVRSMQARGQDARFVATVDGIVECLAAELRAKDTVVVLSNGGFGGIHERLLSALSRAPQVGGRDFSVG